MDEEDAINRIQVVVRVRPILPHESASEVAVTTSADGSNVQVKLLEKPNAIRAGSASRRPSPDGKAWEFDACLNGSTTQAELFDVCGMSELVDAALDGYCVTIFAFGQTGSGKTFTMLGPRLGQLNMMVQQADPIAAEAAYNLHGSASYSFAPGALASAAGRGDPEEEGLLVRCLESAFVGIAARRQEGEDCSVDVSCCEVYNEAVSDLMADDRSRQLQVRQDKAGGFYVEGLRQVQCASAAEAQQQLSGGLLWRHTRSHALNNTSSRSHCITTCTFMCSKPEQQYTSSSSIPPRSPTKSRRRGKLVLVDLAGSERLKETRHNEKEALKETGAINKSLFTLGQVLAALSARSTTGRNDYFVPYRDSKLTQLLWEGLRGSGRALMLACLAPMAAHAEESLNTLHFASMARRIKASPIVLLDPQDQLVMELKATIQQLRQDNRQLATALQQLAVAATAGSLSADLVQSLPPQLLQDALMAGKPSSAPAGSRRQQQQQQRRRRTTNPGRRSSSGNIVNLKSSSVSPYGGAYTSPYAKNYFSSSGSSSKHSGAAPSRSMSAGPSLGYNAELNVGAVGYDSFALPPTLPGSSKQSPTAKRGMGLGSSRHYQQQQQLPPQQEQQQGTFPELQALEAAFSRQHFTAAPGQRDLMQQPALPMMHSPGASIALAAPAPAALAHSGSSRLSLQPALQRMQSGQPAAERPSSATAAADWASAADDHYVPEAAAVAWCHSRAWFGLDPEMTELAYKVHDELMAAKWDANSSEYYKEIDRQVAAAFPARWKHYDHHYDQTPRSGFFTPASPRTAAAELAAAATSADADAGGGRANGATVAGRLVAARPPSPLGQGVRQLHKQGTTSGLRMPALQPALPHMQYHVAGAGSVTSAIFDNASAWTLSPLPALPTGSRHQHQQQSGNGRTATPVLLPAGRSPTPTGSHSSGGRPGRAMPQRGAISTMVFGGMDSSGSMPSSSWSPGSSPLTYYTGDNTVQVITFGEGPSVPQALPGSSHPLPGPGTALADLTPGQLQERYRQERQRVLEELQEAKEEAEAERRRILARIGNALANGGWKS